MTSRRLLLAGALASLVPGLLAGCAGSGSKARPFPVAVSVQTEDGSAVDAAGVEGTLLPGGRRKLGATGPDGLLTVQVEAEEGASLEVEPSCPRGYRLGGGAAIVALRRTATLDGKTPKPLGVAFRCVRTERLVAMIVRAKGAARIPVLLDGREVAQTDSEGISHLLLMAPVNGGFRLVLDTTGRPDLRPQNPSVRYAVANIDELFVFDQTFEQRKVKKRRHKMLAAPFRITK